MADRRMNADALAFLAGKGLSLEEIVEFARISERKADRTNADRQARYREKRKGKKEGDVTRYSNGVTPPIDNTHTPHDISPDGESQTARPDDCTAVVSTWNEMATANSLPACQKLSPSRRKACQARLRDDGLAAIQQAIQRVPASAFLRGETGSWSGATIDFLLRPDTVTKILEGKYDDRPVQPASSAPEAWRGAARPVDNRDGFTRALDDLAFGAGGSPH
jgi:hypothetical protein